jgi:hypothetical protein
MSRPVVAEFELRALPMGTVLTHATGAGYVVIGNDASGYPIVVRQLTATNPSEWQIYSVPQPL